MHVAPPVNVSLCVCTCAAVLAHHSILPVALIPSHPEENKTHTYTQSSSHLASHVKYYVTRSEPQRKH